MTKITSKFMTVTMLENTCYPLQKVTLSKVITNTYTTTN